LINFVRENSKVPVIETGAGIVHTYFDKSGDVAKGKAIIENAKARRVSVCNALDCLVIHEDRLSELPMIMENMDKAHECIVYAIAEFSSKHSEAIVAEDTEIVDYFLKNVDAAVVYANTSTAFTDGAQFGMGAEIGISTQKLHARGPMALQELTSYKWIVRGDGQVRG